MHRLLEADLKEEQSLLQACASRPEGPAAPFVWRAAFRMVSALRASNMMGFAWVGWPSRRLHGSGSLPKGCFSLRTSLVDRSLVSPSSVVSGIRSSSLSTPPVVCFDG